MKTSNAFVCLGLLAFACIGEPTIAQLHSEFASNVRNGCTPLTVQFHDLSTGDPTSWFWDFGNNTTSSLQNPTVVYTDTGTFRVRLIVRNARDADYEERPNYITVSQTPEPQFMSLGDSGCTPLKVQFTNMTGMSNASWLWNFGDGRTDSSQNPAHVFQTKGIYTVSLTATTPDGCVASVTVPSRVRAGVLPTANFSVTPTSGCASDLRYFKNTSLGDISSSSWSFGDGGGSILKDPVYHYQDTGWFSVKLVTADNGCKDSIIKEQVLRVDGPIAIMRVHINCDDRFTVKFVDVSIGEKDRKWNFGDGTSGTRRAETHVYADEGTYTARLKVDNDICFDTSSYRLQVTTKKPEIKIVPQKNSYCKGDSILFVFTNYDTAFARSFGFDFGDDSITDVGPKWDSTTYVYANKGRYTVTGYFTDKEHCHDTLRSSPVIITAPSPQFNFSTPDCKEMPINFEDRSTADGASITRWVWNFDDGTMRYSANQVYSYSFPLTYNVSLRVKDSDGCADSIYREVKVADVPIVHARPDTFLCAGQSITLRAWGASNFTWTSGDGTNCSNCTDPVVTPLQTSTYYVTGSNGAGCSTRDSVTIIVQQKQEVSLTNGAVILCAGDSIRLLARGADSYFWTPQTCMSNSTIANPTISPAASTTFMVIGKDKYSCFTDTATLNVVVNPKPFVNITDSIVQVLSGSNYQILATGSEDVQRWQWLPVNGLSCTNCSVPVATVKGNVTYTVSVSNGLGCSSQDAITIISLCTQQMLYVPNTFSPNNDGVNDIFFPRGKGLFKVKSMRILNRWGQPLFERFGISPNNPAYGWDGTHNGQALNSDVYVYMMEVVCENNATIPIKGNVTLLR